MDEMERKAKEKWNADANIREEFDSYESFEAYFRAKQSGRGQRYGAAKAVTDGGAIKEEAMKEVENDY